MKFPHDVTNQIDVLTDALEDPATDLPTGLARGGEVGHLGAIGHPQRYAGLLLVVASIMLAQMAGSFGGEG